jgi:hypothetical protein
MMISGKGIGNDILNWLGANIGPVFKELSTVVIKEVLVPLLKSKVGLGLNPAGTGLKLAGQGHMMNGVMMPRTMAAMKKRGMGDTGKGSQAMKDKMAKLRAMKKK